MYKISFDYSPAYELIVSLRAYMNKSYHKTTDLGSSWVNSVKSMIEPSFKKELEGALELFEKEIGLEWLIHNCPEKQTIQGFLNWLRELSTGELFEIVALHLESVPNDLINIRTKTVEILTKWNDQYFSSVDSAILQSLYEDASAKNELRNFKTEEELFEEVTNGIRQLPTEDLKEIILIPQYHLKPVNNSIHYKDTIFCYYSCEAVDISSDGPPQSLMRLTQCLADRSRMRILKYISEGPRTFTDLVKYSGLSKSTVHHHVVALRAAGLLIVEGKGASVTAYTLRREAFKKLQGLLVDYFGE